jgi:addiction module HigA family antidote
METTRMPMKNPPHPGAGLKDDIEALGLSVAEAAKGLRVTRQQLYRVINGDCAITPEMAIRLEKAIGSTADAWLRMQMNYDLAQARRRASSIKVKRLEPKVA